ncbi:MAG: hypothetical protein JXR96_16970 [Deltaproteobacteria bacterium]|nr:hypothetical protein [Deltaproteobacteria bacterium]
MTVVVDGNDGTGKTTLVAALRECGHAVRDRGKPTEMTDDETVEAPADDVYLILDAPVEVCRTRLAQAGKDLSERYHTVEDLTYYRGRFQEVAAALPRCAVVDSSGTREETLARALEALEALQAR